jgi:HK97 family phage prohead protease
MEPRDKQVQVRTASFEDVQVRTGEETGDGSMVITGYAAVFNVLSEDLGGFKERINPAAFDALLRTNPDVVINWDHDTRYLLGRTKSGTLELNAVPDRGLRVFNRVAPVSYAEDLRVLMERGDLDQMSFKFIPGEEIWTYPENEDEEIIVEVMTVEALFDVCVCAQGAYPQTQSAVEEHSRSRLQAAIDGGKILGQPEPAPERNLEREAAERNRRLTLARAR